MIPPPSSVELEELVLLAGIGALSYCAVELVRILGPAVPKPADRGRTVLEADPRPLRSPVRIVAAAILVSALAAAGLRLWSPSEWSHLGLGLGLGLLLVVLLVGLTFVVRATVQYRVRQSIDRIDAANAFLAGIRGTAALVFGAVGLTLLLTLAGFLALEGLDPALVGAVFVVWVGATAAALANPRANPLVRRRVLAGRRVLEASALLFAAVTLPMVLAYADPLVLSLVGHATLLGPTFGGLSAIVAAVAALVVRSRPEHARADAFGRGLLAAAFTAVVGVTFLTSWLLAFDLVYFAILIAGVALAVGLASGGAWLATHPTADPHLRYAVLASMGLAVPSVAAVAFWAGGWMGWPTATVWDGSLGLFAVALAGLGCAVVGPALLVLGLAGSEVPPEVDALPPDPLDPLRGAWRSTVRASGRMGEGALSTYLLGATALLLLTFTATDLPLAAAVIGTDPSTLLVPASWASGAVLLGVAVGLAAGFVMSACFARRRAPASPLRDSTLRRALTQPATAALLALGLVTVTALAAGPWTTLGLIPGTLGGAALEITLGLGTARRSDDGIDGARAAGPVEGESLTWIAFLTAVPLLLVGAAYVALLFAPLIHWSPGY